MDVILDRDAGPRRPARHPVRIGGAVRRSCPTVFTARPTWWSKCCRRIPASGACARTIEWFATLRGQGVLAGGAAAPADRRTLSFAEQPDRRAAPCPSRGGPIESGVLAGLRYYAGRSLRLPVAGARPMVIRRATGDDADALTDLAHRAKAHWGYPAQLDAPVGSAAHDHPRLSRGARRVAWPSADGGDCRYVRARGLRRRAGTWNMCGSSPPRTAAASDARW